MAGARGGKTAGSKVIMSPLCASSNACRRAPEPLSAVLVTIMVFPGAGGVSVGAGLTQLLGATKLTTKIEIMSRKRHL